MMVAICCIFLTKLFCFFKQLIILFLLSYSYFVFVYVFCLKSLFKTKQDPSYLSSNLSVNLIFSYLFSFNLNFLFTICFYLLILFKPHARAHKKYSLDKKLLKQMSLDNHESEDENHEIKLDSIQNSHLKILAQNRNLTLKTRNNYGHIRICLKCNIIMPDRCSHCKSCKTCILKRDHHCPWLSKCIGYSNQKYYICMLTYLAFLIVFVLTTLFGRIIDVLAFVRNNFNEGVNLIFILNVDQRTDVIHISALYMLCCLLFFPICLLLINTYCLALSNLTNIEHNFPPFVVESREFEEEQQRTNSANVLGNLKEIFGSSSLLAYMPVWTTPGDGHSFSFNFKPIEKRKCICNCVWDCRITFYFLIRLILICFK